MLSIIYVCVCTYVHVKVALVVSDSVQPHGLQPARLLCLWDSPGRILEWVAMPSSRGSFQFQYQILISYVSCIARQVLYC